MREALIILLPLFAWAAIMAVMFLGYPAVKHWRQCRTDPGRLLFGEIERALRDHPERWEERDRIWSWWAYRIHRGYSLRNLAVSVAGGHRIEPTEGWRIRLGAAIERAEAARKKIAQLNAICDGLEVLDGSNVIPLKSRAS